MIFLPLRMEQPDKRFPLITLLLILSTTAIFVYQLSRAAQGFTLSFAAVPAKIMSEPFRLIRYPTNDTFIILPVVATLLSCTFLHGNLLHLIGNMLYLWIFGAGAEGRLGHFRFFLFYLFCGISASCIHLFSNPGSSIPMVGASGAIAGLLGGHLLLSPRARVVIFFCPFPFILFSRFLRIPAVIFLGLWIILQVFYLKFPSPATQSVALWAHIGGFAAGFLFVGLFRKK